MPDFALIPYRAVDPSAPSRQFKTAIWVPCLNPELRAGGCWEPLHLGTFGATEDESNEKARNYFHGEVAKANRNRLRGRGKPETHRGGYAVMFDELSRQEFIEEAISPPTKFGQPDPKLYCAMPSRDTVKTED